MGEEKKEAAKGFTKRDFLKTALIGAAGVAAGGSLGPAILRAQAKPIRLGLLGVASGPIGMSGEAAFRGVQLWVDEINNKGGLLGRRVEAFQRDTFGKPEEAVRYAREFAAGSNVDLIFAHGSSAEAFAIAAISKDLRKVVFAINETTAFTADPKVRSRYCFRSTRDTLLDNIVGGRYAANKSQELGLTRWYTIAADYSFGRESVDTFLEHLKKFYPKAEIIGQAWPKLGEADFTPHITAIMRAKPDAVYNDLYGGDVTSFIRQGWVYGLFDTSKFFMKSLAEYEAIDAVRKGLGKFPAGLYSATMYTSTFPDTKVNHEFNDAHVKRFGSPPLHWTWGAYTGALLFGEAVRKAKTTETEAVVGALKDLSAQAPTGVGPNGTVTMRSRDNQLIYYAQGWGTTISQEPYLKDIVAGNWNEMLAAETEWLKKKGWL
jgi:branched-chain amino acid transport system substrate-binding protein